MVRVLPDAVDRAEVTTGFIGASIVDVVTAGMYDDPLMVYREYLQNSVDAIDEAEELGRLSAEEGKVNIRIDAGTRTIEIEDNGIGVANDSVELKLGSVGYSDKGTSVSQRGFRGIGRLGGLGYCDKVTFVTRSNAHEDVATVTWDGTKLRSFLAENDQVAAEAAVKAACSISFSKPTPDAPPHFCKVTLSGVHTFRDDALMRQAIVQDYLAQTGPLPFDHSRFSHARKIEDRLSDLPSYATYSVSLDGQLLQKPYSDSIVFSAGFSESIQDVEFFEFRSSEGDVTAIGWYGVTNLLGTIPKELGVTGIRIRSGNIQVGDEDALANHFGERRFAGWHLGEVHVASDRIQLNARRDGFEHSKEYESFLEYASLLGRVLSKQCREASDDRGTVRAAKTALTRLENLIMHTTSLLGPSHREVVTRKADRLLSRIEEMERQAELSPELLKRLEAVRERRQQLESLPLLTSCLDREVLRDKTHEEVVEAMCRALVQDYSEASSAEDLISKMTAQFRNGHRVGNEE